MGSMIAIGTSFLIFFLALGFMWTIGVHVLSALFESMPALTNQEWSETDRVIQERIKTIMVWVLPILLLFASVKMLVNAASRGAD